MRFRGRRRGQHETRRRAELAQETSPNDEDLVGGEGIELQREPDLIREDRDPGDAIGSNHADRTGHEHVDVAQDVGLELSAQEGPTNELQQVTKPPVEPRPPAAPQERDGQVGIEPPDDRIESLAEREFSENISTISLPDLPSNTSERRSRPLPRVIAVSKQKGGVGKTTTTVNLGAALAEIGYRILVVDLDPQGNATTGLGIDARNFEHSMYDVMMHGTPLEDCIEATSVRNLFVAPATIDLAGIEIELVPAFSRELRLRRALEPVLEDFDFVLIDCPPSLGLITVNGLAAASEVLVPIQCEYYALEGLGQLLRNVHLVASN